MFGAGEVRYHFIHVEDLCDAMCLCAERDEALGEVFIIADDHALTLNEIVRVMSEALGIKPPRLRLPYPLLYGAAAVCEFVLKPLPGVGAPASAPRGMVQLDAPVRHRQGTAAPRLRSQDRA